MLTLPVPDASFAVRLLCLYGRRDQQLISMRSLTRTVGAINFSDRHFAEAVRQLQPSEQQRIFDAFLELVYQLGDDYEAGNHDLRESDRMSQCLDNDPGDAQQIFERAS